MIRSERDVHRLITCSEEDAARGRAALLKAVERIEDEMDKRPDGAPVEDLIAERTVLNSLYVALS